MTQQLEAPVWKPIIGDRAIARSVEDSQRIPAVALLECPVCHAAIAAHSIAEHGMWHWRLEQTSTFT